MINTELTFINAELTLTYAKLTFIDTVIKNRSAENRKMNTKEK